MCPGAATNARSDPKGVGPLHVTVNPFPRKIQSLIGICLSQLGVNGDRSATLPQDKCRTVQNSNEPNQLIRCNFQGVQTS